ncbi:alpha-N-arabinofuranosidase [Micromonospora sp. NPDC048830]|uniref:alpha-N-arabinofuranosidase n=1 Tax=Micromonospora sp. NPDC048830 TaxID=3364257 RepID=UPI0037246099
MARIRVDADRAIGTVDRKIFSGFVEHLGRCIYGGLYDPGSPFDDETGFRRDVAAALKALNPPVLRWPGGNFASNYQWTDGIGPAEKRPKRLELAWFLTEPNLVGTDEFLRWCEREGYEPYLCVNMGSGTFSEAQAWVEYCNGTKDTYWANKRRENGREEPYGVKLWALGNEMYGDYQVGQLTAEEYVSRARQFANVMKRTDRSIRLVSCGQNGWSEWDRVVLEGLADLVDYHSIHIYTGSSDYWVNVLAPHQAERSLRAMRALIDGVTYRKKLSHEIKVAYDEWNVWYRYTEGVYEPSDQPPLEERYDHSDALAVATYLNIFVRHCRTVGMANLAQMVNVIAPIFTRPDGMFLQTIYHPFRMLSEHTQSVALDTFVDGPTHDLVESPENMHWLWPQPVADMNPFQVLDVAATRDPDKSTLTLSVVNRSPDEEITADVELRDVVVAGAGQVTTLRHSDPRATNDFDRPDDVTPVESVAHVSGGSFRYAFPPCSITVFRLPTEPA